MPPLCATLPRRVKAQLQSQRCQQRSAASLTPALRLHRTPRRRNRPLRRVRSARPRAGRRPGRSRPRSGGSRRRAGQDRRAVAATVRWFAASVSSQRCGIFWLPSMAIWTSRCCSAGLAKRASSVVGIGGADPAPARRQTGRRRFVAHQLLDQRRGWPDRPPPRGQSHGRARARDRPAPNARR